MNPENNAQGIIYKAVSGFYYVKSAEETVCCVARGRFRYNKNTPLAGDRVVFAATEPGNGVLVDILPRKNVFIRPPLANIDKMVIVASKAAPATDPYLIDKMTVIALKNNCNPVVCINKSDIDGADDLYNIYKTTGFPVLRTSALTGAGIDNLIREISGCVCAFCGNSGVGKSSILNTIDPGFGIATGDISRKLGRGRHTTRHVELFGLSCGAMIADTPGFSAFDTGYIAGKEEMQYLFPEFSPYAGKCRFDDCAHIAEPGCAVIEAVDAKLLHTARHNNYKRLYKEASVYKQWEIKE